MEIQELPFSAIKQLLVSGSAGRLRKFTYSILAFLSFPPLDILAVLVPN